MSNIRTYPSIKWKFFLALIPFLIMVLVNEGVRLSQSERFEYFDVPVLNSTEVHQETCTWNCHNNTTYCKKHHVKFAKGHFGWIDPIYFGIIQLLMSTGSYGLANLVFLVVLWPLLMYWLFLRALRNRQLLKRKA